MPVRFRRTFKIFPGVKINISKGGVSGTIGFPGFHINIGKHGIRQTIGLPGSGLSETSYIVKHDDDSEKEKDKDREPRAHRSSERIRLAEENETTREDDPEGEGCAFWVVGLVLLAGIAALYWAGTALGWIPPHWLSNALGSMADWARSAGR